MNDKLEFYTLKGYELQEEKEITYAMEDYLEMICRIAKEKKYIRISNLASNLNVRPSSVSKMVNNLKRAALINFEKYGHIELTESGYKLGNYLIYRHNVLNEFLCIINNSEDEIEQVEKIEHFINKKTISNIEKVCAKIRN